MAKAKRTSAAMRGHFASAKVAPKRKIAEFRVSEDALIDVGEEISAEHFLEGQKVDISGTSIGKGFAGGMKRHGFHGGPKTHGQSDRWRAPGSVGAGSTPGRVFKGKRMAGHYGNETITTRGLEVVSVDLENNILSLSMKEAKKLFERAYLTRQLELVGGKMSELSRRVGMERTNLYRKLQSLDVEYKKKKKPTS